MSTTKTNANTGCLYVVGTPIGNIEDITARAVKVLASVEKIACENTRRTLKFLNRLNIRVHKDDLILLDDVHESSAAKTTISFLDRGKDVALISDAGTPLVSDPGFTVVREASSKGLTVQPVPGSSAITTIASVCPIPLNRFHFIGFLRPSGSAKRMQLTEILDSNKPTIFFDTARRFENTLETIQELGHGTRKIFTGRELTKLHEELIHSTVEELLESLRARDSLKGEIVCVLEASKLPSRSVDVDKLIMNLVPHMKTAQIARIVRDVTSIDRDEAYARVMELQSRES